MKTLSVLTPRLGTDFWDCPENYLWTIVPFCWVWGSEGVEVSTAHIRQIPRTFWPGKALFPPWNNKGAESDWGYITFSVSWLFPWSSGGRNTHSNEIKCKVLVKKKKSFTVHVKRFIAQISLAKDCSHFKVKVLLWTSYLQRCVCHLTEHRKRNTKLCLRKWGWHWLRTRAQYRSRDWRLLPKESPQHWRGSRILSDAVLRAQLNSAATLRKVLALPPCLCKPELSVPLNWEPGLQMSHHKPQNY